MIDRRDGNPWFVLLHVVLVNLVAAGIAWNHVVMLSTEIMEDLGLGIGRQFGRQHRHRLAWSPAASR